MDNSASSSSPGRRRHVGSTEDECRKRLKTVVALADSPATSSTLPLSTTTTTTAHMIDCGICFDSEYELRGKLDSCNHGFCLECISKWATTSTCCPLCKQRFVEISKINTTTGHILATIPCAKRDFGTPVPHPGQQMYDSDDDEEDDDFYGDDYDDEEEDDDDEGLHGPFGLFWTHNPFFSSFNMFEFGGGHVSDEDGDDEDEEEEEESLQQQPAAFCPTCGLLVADCACHQANNNTVINLDDDEDEVAAPILIQQGSGSVDQPFELDDSDEED